MAQIPAAKFDPIVVLVDDAVLPPAAAAQVGNLSPRIELLEQLTPTGLSRADVVFTCLGGFDPAEAPKLKWVQTESASIAHLTATKLAACGIPVANARGALSPNVAELAIGMMLTLTRRLVAGQQVQSAGRWPDLETRLALYGVPCYGRTLGVLGYGSIGRQTARIASGLGMRILACNTSGRQTRDTGFCLPKSGDANGDLPCRWYAANQLDRMLPECDVVVLCMPLTEQSRQLVNAEVLGYLRSDALLIDVGRGGVLDLAALCDRLSSGQLAGAALDVYEQEPLPGDHPLWQIPNVLLLPHIGAGTLNRNEFVAQVLIENLTRFLAGRELVNLVSFTRGY